VVKAGWPSRFTAALKYVMFSPSIIDLADQQKLFPALSVFWSTLEVSLHMAFLI